MKLRLIAFVLILWTETLADQSPGTSIVFVHFYLGKMNIFYALSNFNIKEYFIY